MSTRTYRFYNLLRKQGYTPQQAVWNLRHCSDYFWQTQFFIPVHRTVEDAR